MQQNGRGTFDRDWGSDLVWGKQQFCFRGMYLHYYVGVIFICRVFSANWHADYVDCYFAI
jgi:hypothetical protein